MGKNDAIEICEIVDFYGQDRFRNSGKHPSEFIAESEAFETFEQIEERAKKLSKLWRMAVDVRFSGEKNNSGYYSKETGFVWHR